MSHEDRKMVWSRERTGKANTTDPLGQSYLPGYFCPAALFDSRETKQNEGGAETTQRDYCSLNQTDESQKTWLRLRVYW